MTTDEAVAHGIEQTAGVVTSAAIVMVAVFCDLRRRCGMIEFKQIGRRARGRGPDRRDDRPRRPAPGGDEAAGRVELVPAKAAELAPEDLARAPAARACERVARETAGTRKTGSGRFRFASRMRIGVLTGGGDCPGLNAVIRGIVRKLDRRDVGVVVSGPHGGLVRRQHPRQGQVQGSSLSVGRDGSNDMGRDRPRRSRAIKRRTWGKALLAEEFWSFLGEVPGSLSFSLSGSGGVFCRAYMAAIPLRPIRPMRFGKDLERVHQIAPRPDDLGPHTAPKGISRQ